MPSILPGSGTEFAAAPRGVLRLLCLVFKVSKPLRGPFREAEIVHRAGRSAFGGLNRLLPARVRTAACSSTNSS